ncbi:nitrogen regulation protein [bacterium BMS3Bbin14]|nr:nitrogen regulation protein [bacterium BMS3Bbin14]
MTRNILIVDNDKDFLLSLKKRLSKAGPTLSILEAEDWVGATEMLESNSVSLVIAYLQTGGVNDFTLLAHITEFYPDIPVITLTAHNAPDMERLAGECGATACIGKDFSSEEIADLIDITFENESDCGTLHVVSSASFLQLMEMEQKTCTIRVCEKSSGNRGVLFFRDGDLLDARSVGLRAEAAARQIFLWEDVCISIQGSCPQDEKIVQGDLRAIILEAMRMKDEAGTQEEVQEPEMEHEAVVELPPEEKEGGESSGAIISSQQMLAQEIGERGAFLDINHDGSWEELAAEAVGIGAFFDLGAFKGGYVDRGGGNCFVLLPDKKTKVVAVNSQCSRDRIIQILSNQ